MDLYLWAAQRILAKHRRPMRVREILELAYEDGFFADNIQGATPHKTMHARLSTDIVENGEQSNFIRTGRGVFFLKSLLSRDPSSDSISQEMSELGLPLALAPYHARRREPPPPREKVLVIPRRLFAQYCRFQGIRQDNGKLLGKILLRDTCKYLPRLVAEETNDYKQVVTYVIIRNKNALLTFRRGVYSRVASFLRGSRCIGFGGHVVEDDFSMFSLSDMGVSASALRELYEEIDVDEPNRLRDPDRLKSYRRILVTEGIRRQLELAV